ncbi:MAG: bifunctional riboflavin kinase/FAD synthetase [Nitrospirae bacterium]|nr:bifunctional riboflavin kinase/FAD synthetase [Nitrospirota bacterium]MCL5422286.1 bifunctional riboflavin kinase/FAD synthetase [Nitrospirota bacterium]
MFIIKGLENLKERYRNAVLTIGNFDGVHIGHQKIFRNVVERAKAIKGTSLAVTFDPHPLKVIAPERGVRLMTSFPEKARLMELFGIEALLCIHFDREFANTKPDDFIRDVIADRIGAKEVIVGHSYVFGKGKKGSTALLRRRSGKYGFTFRVVRNARLYSEVVSSSRIRSLLARGRVCESSWLLGRPYMIEGKVVRGAGRGGSLLHVPTANIETSNELVPKEGVYAVKVGLEGKIFDGAANIGRNPTFGEQRMSYEVHILDFSENILGRGLKLYFIDRIRDEKTFPDFKVLHEHILRDIERAKEILRTKKYPKFL